MSEAQLTMMTRTLFRQDQDSLLHLLKLRTQLLLSVPQSLSDGLLLTQPTKQSPIPFKEHSTLQATGCILWPEF